MELNLLPIPAKIVVDKGTITLREAQIVVPAAPTPDTLFAATQLQAAVEKYAAIRLPILAGGATHAMPIRLAVDPAAGAPQSYELAIRHDAIILVGADEAGLFYGVQTLIQVFRQRGHTLPTLHIADAPQFPQRGVMLDISRDKVPTLQTVLDLVDQLSHLKINQLQLYMEHTFAYSQHPEVWAQASPMTHEDILRLDAHCRQRHVQLVPNQNSFGHMERWLNLPRYLPLAEAPTGYDTPWGTRSEHAFSLCPTDPQAIDLLKGLYAELLPNFSSNLFNVGCDETWDLGQGRSKALVEKRGKTRVYLDFLIEIHRLVQASGKQMMFWGDIILHQPELIAELPKNIVAMEWGYESDHPFEKDGALFAKAGVPFYVCPGTSSWNTIAGRTDNCLQNLKCAAENGAKYGAIGYLNTDWGDNGHLQYLPVSYLGFAAGAAYGWAPQAARQMDLRKALDLHAFHDAAGVMGKVAYELGNVYKCLKVQHNCSRLFWLLLDEKRGAADVTMEQLEAAKQAIEQAIAPLALAKMDRADAQLIKDEFANAAAMLLHAIRRGRRMLKADSESPVTMAADLRQIIGRHESLWLSRNRPGGLADSAGRLKNAMAMYK